MERQTSTVVVFHETYWRTEYNSAGDVISHERKQLMRESAGKKTSRSVTLTIGRQKEPTNCTVSQSFIQSATPLTV